MLSVYTRHYPPCTQADSNHRRCHCPKWINGTLPTGQFVRVSAKTRSWENAERKARIMEVNADPLRPAIPDVRRKIAGRTELNGFAFSAQRVDDFPDERTPDAKPSEYFSILLQNFIVDQPDERPIFDPAPHELRTRNVALMD